MLIFPAIDLIDGNVVRLRQGDYDQKIVYGTNPVAVALEFAEQGAQWLHVVDLDAARSGTPKNSHVIRDICSSSRLKVQVGGGIRSLEAAQILLDLGVERVIVGTKLADDDALAEQFFQQLGHRVVAGIDTKQGMVATHGWEQTSLLEGLDFARKLVGLGCRRVIVTDVAKDGALAGPNLEMMKLWVTSLTIPCIASGGVTDLADLNALASTDVEGVIVGKALYEGRFSLPQALEASSRVGR